MADVAREAGVSLMTVSRVVNNKGNVSTETKQHVQDVIELLDFRPSGIARGLATDQTQTIGLVVPDVENPFFSAVTRGVENAAYTEGYNVFLCNTEENPNRELTVLQSLEDNRVDGFILCSTRLTEKQLEEVLPRQSAAVLINRKLPTKPSWSQVGTVRIDDTKSGRVAVRHLLNFGHRAIGFLSGSQNSSSGHGRLRGYQTELEKAGIDPKSDYTLPCQPTVSGGYLAAIQLINRHPEITAVYCYNDLVAVGVLQACNETGRRVPIDLAVVGNDDIPLAAIVTPPLTTCRVPCYELGTQVVCALLNILNQPDGFSQDIVLQSEFIVRASAPRTYQEHES
jgi:LacI family transcriptional regulator